MYLFYSTSGSVASLISGLIFGGLAIYGATITSKNPKNCAVCLATASVLLAIMAFRFYRTQKMMPAGLITFLRYNINIGSPVIAVSIALSQGLLDSILTLSSYNMINICIAA